MAGSARTGSTNARRRHGELYLVATTGEWCVHLAWRVSAYGASGAERWSQYQCSLADGALKLSARISRKVAPSGRKFDRVCEFSISAPRGMRTCTDERTLTAWLIQINRRAPPEARAWAFGVLRST